MAVERCLRCPVLSAGAHLFSPQPSPRVPVALPPRSAAGPSGPACAAQLWAESGHPYGTAPARPQTLRGCTGTVQHLSYQNYFSREPLTWAPSRAGMVTPLPWSPLPHGHTAPMVTLHPPSPPPWSPLSHGHPSSTITSPVVTPLLWSPLPLHSMFIHGRKMS